MLARRLLPAGGGGSFTIPEPPPPEAFTLTAAPDGAWSWFGDPRALTHSGHTYLGYVDTSGNVCVRVYVHATDTVGAEIILKAALDVDDHVNPSFAVLPNGKLAAWYCRHEPGSTTPHQRISTNTVASDPTLSGGFAAETDLDANLGGTSYDYPVPFVEGSRVYLFFRNLPGSNSYRLIRSHSDDNGATWAALTTVVQNTTNSNRAYWKLARHDDFIHVAWTDGTPNIDTTDLYHFYWDVVNDTYHLTDGTTIAGLPFDAPDLTPVYSASNTWVWDIAVDPSTGYPRIIHPVWATPFTDVRYHRAQWNGSAWSSTEIATGGAGIDVTGVYSGGAVMDNQDPDVVWASRQVSGQWEIWRYTLDGSWSGVAITSGSSSKNIRPYVPPGRTDELLVVWLTGTYTGYTTYSMGITGAR